MKYTGTTRSKKIEQGEHILYIGKNIYIYIYIYIYTQSNLVGKTEGKRQLGRPKCE
jgi:hypothetical protein